MSTKVGYLGPNTPKGPDTTTFGYIAAEKHFAGSRSVTFVNFETHTEICVAVAKKEIRYGVVAIENVVNGVVAETLRAITKDAKLHGGVQVCAEVSLPIELFYLRKKTTSKKPPSLVLSHAVGLSQCSRFVQCLKKEHGIDSDVRKSTGEAAVEASQNVDVACIASVRAEKEYHLRRLESHSVVDNSNSKTRFWVLAKEHADRTGKDKTAIVVELRQDQSGALWRTLGCFCANHTGDGAYTMKPEQDRPNLLLPYPMPISGKRWEYSFLLEFNGYIEDPAMQEGLRAFSDSGLSLGPAQVLGSYPNVTADDLQ